MVLERGASIEVSPEELQSRNSSRRISLSLNGDSHRHEEPGSLQHTITIGNPEGGDVHLLEDVPREKQLYLQ